MISRNLSKIIIPRFPDTSNLNLIRPFDLSDSTPLQVAFALTCRFRVARRKKLIGLSASPDASAPYHVVRPYRTHQREKYQCHRNLRFASATIGFASKSLALLRIEKPGLNRDLWTVQDHCCDQIELSNFHLYKCSHWSYYQPDFAP